MAKNINEKKTVGGHELSDDMLTNVNGGGMEHLRSVLYEVGDTVKFCYIHTEGIKVFGYFEFVGTVKSYYVAPEGTMYTIVCNDPKFVEMMGSNEIQRCNENVIGKA